MSMLFRCTVTKSNFSGISNVITNTSESASKWESLSIDVGHTSHRDSRLRPEVPCTYVSSRQTPARNNADHLVEAMNHRDCRRSARGYGRKKEDGEVRSGMPARTAGAWLENC